MKFDTKGKAPSGATATRFGGRCADPQSATWDGLSHGAEHERAVMLQEFRLWVVKKRATVDEELLRLERMQRDLAPLAATGLELAQTPADVPLTVLEFAQVCLEIIQSRRRLALLTTYYLEAVGEQHAGSLAVNPGDEAEINELWEWFVEDRKAGAA